MDIVGHTALLVAVTSFALGFSVLARNVRNKLYIAFAVVSSLVSAWALSFFLNQIWSHYGIDWFYRSHLLLNIWLAPASLAFIRMMVRIRDPISRVLLHLSIPMAVILSIAVALRLDHDADWVLQAIYFAPGLVVIQTMRLMWIDRKIRVGQKVDPKVPMVGMSRRHLIYLGGMLVLSTSVMDHVPWLPKAIPVIGNLLLPIYLFFISQAISQQRLLNFGALFSRFLVMIAVALTLTGVYALLVAWIENSPGLFVLNSFIASFFILTLLEPLRRLVSYFTHRLLAKKHRKLEALMGEAQARLSGLVDPEAIFSEILATLDAKLNPEWSALFVLNRAGNQFVRVKTKDHLLARISEHESHLSGAPLPEMLADHPLMDYCHQLRSRGELTVILDQMLENEIERSASRRQRARLTSLAQSLRVLGGNLLLPFIDPDAKTGRILGFVVLRAPAPPEAWGNNWGLLRTIYHPYFAQASRILRNLELYVRQREIERLATVGEMAAGLAHEIRNPLGAIKGAAQFLDPTSDRPESRFLKVIIEEVDRLNRVVTQFLDYSRPHVAELERVNVSELALKTIELLTPTAPAGTNLTFTPAIYPALMDASPGQIQQVLVNLIQNSFKALEGKSDGKVTVSVQIERARDSREVALIVEDNGRGIRKQDLGKLFIPFFTTSPSGTGLGLSICQKIVQAHDGRIEVLSEEGKFARFSVLLPFAGESGMA